MALWYLRCLKSIGKSTGYPYFEKQVIPLKGLNLHKLIIQVYMKNSMTVNRTKTFDKINVIFEPFLMYLTAIVFRQANKGRSIITGIK